MIVLLEYCGSSIMKSIPIDVRIIFQEVMCIIHLAHRVDNAHFRSTVFTPISLEVCNC